ncbi:hypothetical protein [Fluviicola chungangensis]|uniref:Mercuric transport protein MerT n=1 Tax=Fluviicola chungangensis TaxID=2597671 RepID=A0A556MJI4_9FLAO|nr:hypothetical protein [Fluviicola chungangensis]TSJ40070.1 hypothetical protein FO442_15845 [Fluviicola chungangensis]
MKQKRTIWTILTGGLTSTAPVLLACCKSGACVGVCASPVASLFGVSSATIASSPVMNVIEPLLIAISAVSFTISYYSLYVIPKLNCNTGNACDCAPNDKEIRKTKRRKAIFWIGLAISVTALTYFAYEKYNSASSTKTECTAPGKEKEASSCSTSGECTESGCE